MRNSQAYQAMEMYRLRFARGCVPPSSLFRLALLPESFGGLIVSLALFLSAADVALMAGRATLTPQGRMKEQKPRRGLRDVVGVHRQCGFGGAMGSTDL